MATLYINPAKDWSIDLEKVTRIRKDDAWSDRADIELDLISGDSKVVRYQSPGERDAEFDKIIKLMSRSHKNMLSEISSDFKGFVKDNRQTIYVILLLVLLDHFIFEGAFRARLKEVMERLIGRAEKLASGEPK